MKNRYYIVCCLIALLAINNIYAQSPKFRDLPPQNYTVGTPIAPLVPNPRPGSGNVPAVAYGQVSTVAGNGAAAATNGAATQAAFKNPLDVKFDTQGNLFVADADNNLIRKITPAGLVSTFAGDGTAGFKDGIGTAAKFSHPTGLLFDPAGNLYVVDQGNNAIRKITPDGTVSLFAGVPGTFGATNNTFNNPTAIAIDANGDFYITDSNNFKVRQVPAAGGFIVPFAGSTGRGVSGPYDGPGVEARFASPLGITYGPDGNLYVVDNELIRKITPSAIASTVAGVRNSMPPSFDGDSKTANFTNAYGIAINDAYTMYISETGNQTIRRFGRQEDYVSTLCGGTGQAGYIDGIGPLARVNKPSGVCLDNTGFLYFADAGNNRIRKVATVGYQIFPALPPGLVFEPTTGVISGTPTAPSPATDYTIVGYNTSGRGLYVVNIQVNLATRQTQTITFNPLPVKKETDPDFPLIATSTNNSLPITFESSDISVATISDGKIHILGPGTVTITASQKGNPYYSDATPVARTLVVNSVPVVFKHPTVIAKGNPVLIPVSNTGTVTVKPTDAATITYEAGQQDPVVQLKDSVFNCTNIGPQTLTITAGYGPDPADPLSAQFNYPSNLVYDPVTGSLYIADNGNYKIRQISGIDGRVTTLAGSGQPGKADGPPKTAAFSRGLLSITTDLEGNVYVCDVLNSLIRKITPAGIVSSFATDALSVYNDLDPMTVVAIAVDQNDNIYASDGYRIYKVSHDGSTASVFAGSGLKYTGTNLENNTDGIGAAASFNSITGLFFDKKGDLYVSSSALNGQNTIRKVTSAGVVSTIYAKSDGALGFARLVVDSKGNIFVGSSEPKIYKVTPNGILSVFTGSTVLGDIGSADGVGNAAKFNNPQGITIDGNDNLYIADGNNHLIRKVTPAGVVTTIAGSGVGGFFDNTNISNKQKTDITAVIISPITITSTYTSATIPFLDACPATVPDYTATATAQSACTNVFHFTQSPAAGTVLTDGQTVDVILTANDDLSPYNKASVTFKLTASRIPTPTVTITPAVVATCEGAPVTFTATAANKGNAPGYQWQINGIDAFAGDSVFTTPALHTGDIVTVVVTNNDGCMPVASAPSASPALTVIPAVTSTFTILPSVTIPVCPGSTVNFTVVSSNTQLNSSLLSYQWQLNGDNVGSNSPAYANSSLANGDVLICLVTIADKCTIDAVSSNTFTAQVRTAAECAIIPTNTFTPNGDGVNDLWEIPVLKNYPNCKVTIFNRYGKLIFESVGYGNPWDGNYSGRPLPSGVYYYIVDTKTFMKPIAGSITILR